MTGTIDSWKGLEMFEWKTSRPGMLEGKTPSSPPTSRPTIRFTRHGLGYYLRPGIWGTKRWGSIRQMDNGWRMMFEGGDFYCVYEIKENGNAKTVCGAWGLRFAQWRATLKYLERLFPDAPDQNVYLKAAASPQEWLPLQVWADRLDELDCPDGQRLRQLLPQFTVPKRRTTRGRTPCSS